MTIPSTTCLFFDPRSFLRASSGNLTVVVSLGTVAVVFALGAAIDFGRVLNTRTALSGAVDAAVLQAGASNLYGEDELLELAQQSLAQNYDETRYGEITGSTLTLSGTTLALQATARYPTSFMSLAGLDHVDVPVEAELRRVSNSIELSLVLDTTSSMSSSEFATLQTAAKSLAESVVQGDQTDFSTRVAIIPYSYGVNLGTLAADARGIIAAGTCTSPGCDNYQFSNYYGTAKTFVVTDCVTERTGTYAYTDNSVSAAAVGYLYAPTTGYCLSTNTLLPLSSDIDEIESTIDSLVQGGATAGQTGVAWGWYALSPNIGMWSDGSEPAAYDAANTLKIAVVMTDGQFNTPYCNGVSASDGTNEDPTKRINCKATNGSSASQAVTMCTAMKAAGITIYAVGFNISGTSTAKATMKSCASSSTHLYLPDSMTDLQSAFESIANEVVAIRLSK